ncbi:DNA-binding transcriptional regulator, MocR family, contains an aminotransferase domain [Faunimonas pinastri]|uniref:DNA-binding transcriptional regulator, MocR family, contains an aminotransferase domain n=1 Tax=Faunimonas pinastri TaxID=1855383 RepID=A0A1H9LKA8_9HYPH|nr:PLP-dependent aminotransferase family protein [Faunimonas pinastri]SER11818.1 DNA-binding transcriptional regulator, MocR family, contains an aminotransferase domain [Faunimonas pinastri]
MTRPGSTEWFAEKLGDRSANGIALETSALIRSGELAVGAKLPAIRDLAFVLGVSPATVSAAWSELRRQKIIIGRGRNGSWVNDDRYVPKPKRLASSGNYGTDVLDLRNAVPDVDLLPPLAAAMAHGASAQNLNSYVRSRVLPELEEVVRQDWPYEAEAFLSTNGGYDAVYALLHAVVTPGALVAIEDPTAMRLLDIVEDLGARALPVRCDEQGPLPASLAEAMTRKPVAFLFQPRLHSVTGRTMTAERLAALGDVLEGTTALVIEDDGVGDISDGPRISLGGRFPERVVHILSYSKTLGPDLRIAVLSGSKTVVDQVQHYRSFSAGWTSRVLQSATAWLLRDRETQDLLQTARGRYRERRQRIASALRANAVPVADGQSLCIWVPVPSEPFAMVTLAARGIAVNPGSKFSMHPVSHIRVATASLRDRYDEVAEAIVLGCQS